MHKFAVFGGPQRLAVFVEEVKVLAHPHSRTGACPATVAARRARKFTSWLRSTGWNAGGSQKQAQNDHTARSPTGPDDNLSMLEPIHVELAQHNDYWPGYSACHAIWRVHFQTRGSGALDSQQMQVANFAET